MGITESLNRRPIFEPHGAVTDCFSAVAPSILRERNPAKNAARRRVNRHGGPAKHTCVFGAGTQPQSDFSSRAISVSTRALCAASFTLDGSSSQSRNGAFPCGVKIPRWSARNTHAVELNASAHLAPFFSRQSRRAAQCCDDATQPALSLNFLAWQTFRLVRRFGPAIVFWNRSVANWPAHPTITAATAHKPLSSGGSGKLKGGNFFGTRRGMDAASQPRG